MSVLAERGAEAQIRSSFHGSLKALNDRSSKIRPNIVRHRLVSYKECLTAQRCGKLHSGAKIFLRRRVSFGASLKRAAVKEPLLPARGERRRAQSVKLFVQCEKGIEYNAARAAARSFFIFNNVALNAF